MNIEFIKWLCEKAEGWYYDEEEDSLCFEAQKGFSCCGSSPVPFNGIYYPLLLQRAIEGVNRASDLISIGQYALDIAVSSDDTLYREYFLIEEYETIDQAKEAALKWVWEDEK